MAAVSDVDICNQALTNLGVDSAISSLTDDSSNARACNRLFARLRDQLLRQHAWNFAINRATLTALSATVGYEYAFSYQLPTSPKCIRVLELREERDEKLGPGYAYQIESLVDGANTYNVLSTDANTARIKYIKEVTDPTQFDTLFVQALVDLLTARLSMPITQSRSTAEAWAAQAVRSLEDAKEANVLEGFEPRTRKMDDVGSWVAFRI